jgi:hypothetical protein
MQQEKKDRKNRKKSSKYIDRIQFKSESRERRSIDKKGINNASLGEPNYYEPKRQNIVNNKF